MRRRFAPLDFFRRRQRLTRVMGYTATFGVVFGLGVAIAVWNLVGRGDRWPSVEVLERYEPRQTSRLYAADGRFVAEIGLKRRTLATLEEIPRVVQDAFIITEDKRFYRSCAWVGRGPRACRKERRREHHRHFSWNLQRR